MLLSGFSQGPCLSGLHRGQRRRGELCETLHVLPFFRWILQKGAFLLLAVNDSAKRSEPISQKNPKANCFWTSASSSCWLNPKVKKREERRSSCLKATTKLLILICLIFSGETNKNFMKEVGLHPSTYVPPCPNQRKEACYKNKKAACPFNSPTELLINKHNTHHESRPLIGGGCSGQLMTQPWEK